MVIVKAGEAERAGPRATLPSNVTAQYLLLEPSPNSHKTDQARTEQPGRGGYRHGGADITVMHRQRGEECFLIVHVLAAVREDEDPRAVRIQRILRTRPAEGGLKVGKRTPLHPKSRISR